MNKIYTVIAFFCLATFVNAQVAKNNTPLSRAYFHEQIDRTQKDILALPGITGDLNYAATGKIDSLQAAIEANAKMDNNNKIKFLRGLNEALGEYVSACRGKRDSVAILPDLVNVFAQCLPLELNNESIEGIVTQYSYQIEQIIISNFAYSKNAGIEAIKNIALLKYLKVHPEKIYDILRTHPGLPFTDSLIIIAAHRDPQATYDNAAAYDALADSIHHCDDPLVKIISQMARMKTGRQLFPFLDDLYHDKTTFEKIASVINDSAKYYKLLVKTEIDYADRVRQKDTPMAMKDLTLKLAFNANDIYVSQINALHESPDNVRFKIIDNLSPEELYYLAVLCEEEIYTSSYVKGVYPRIFKKMQKGDSLLMNVRFDHFKKFIKMAANYNTLDDFLKRMDKDNAELLMKAFVKGLDKTNSLEDAVDVANSFASVNDKALRKLILTEVQYNLQKAKDAGNTRGKNIYGILNILFLSMDTTNRVDVSKLLGIPPVYFVSNKNLQDTSGKIIVQQFTYGDKDGETNFNSFISSVSNSNWKITNNPEWVTVSSTHGTHVVIYTNKPLDEKKSLDDKAQHDLGDYLFSNDLNPVIVIHRGHSYYLPSTLKQLVSSAQVILLGSCGGYQSLNKVLTRCPTAHIVASKQVGSGSVNEPIINAVLETVRQGKDLNWPALWNNLGKLSLSKDLFEDYVPPYKNLGALFIMAYNRMLENE